MPFRSTWSQNENVFTLEFFDVVTLNEVWAAADESLKFIGKSAAQAVHVVVDLSRAREMPDDLLGLAQLFDADYWLTHQRKTGWVVIVGVKTPVRRMIATTLSHLLRFRLSLAPSMPDALAFLATTDQAVHEAERAAFV